MSDKPCSRENGFRVDCIKLYGDVMAENARLKAEVERLRKAGDAMIKAFVWLPQTIAKHHQEAWTAAKEGKPSV